MELITLLSVIVCLNNPDFSKCQLYVEECIWDEGTPQTEWCYGDYMEYGQYVGDGE